MIFEHQSKWKMTLLVISGCILILGGILVLILTYRDNAIQNSMDNNVNDSIPQQTTLTGTYICLPHKDTSGPQTLECALGLKSDDGNNYALDMAGLLGSEDNPKMPVNVTRLQVTGLLVPIEAISSDQWFKYDIQGIMAVEKLEKL